MSKLIEQIEIDGREEDLRETVNVRPPSVRDAVEVHDLIAVCPPLDQNSLYASILQCTHFADHCALARSRQNTVGWVSGYTLPLKPDTYFLWQIAVAENARGLGLPKRMITSILSRPVCQSCRFLQATITSDNDASWRMFESLARFLKAPLRIDSGFDKATDFGGRHESEKLIEIGPFEPPPAAL